LLPAKNFADDKKDCCRQKLIFEVVCRLGVIAKRITRYGLPIRARTIPYENDVVSIKF
jgi:hypothetical protein